jgi:adenylate cyclase
MDYFHRALGGWTFTKEGMLAARGLLTKAIERDPGFAKAYGKLAWSHMVDSSYAFSDDYEGSMEKAREWAVKAVAVDDGDSWAHWALGSYHMFSQRHELALEEFQKALDCNPNDAEVITDYGLCHSYAGQAEEGIEIALKAMRLNPYHQDWYTSQLGQLYFDARRYDKAIATFASLRWLDSAIMRVYQAASFAMLDRKADAAASVRRALELDPKASIEKWGDIRLAPYAKEVYLQHFRTALRKAGLPE